jgi:hypothetical protein
MQRLNPGALLALLCTGTHNASYSLEALIPVHPKAPSPIARMIQLAGTRAVNSM